ncbi:heme ABC transporter ATP-binding protein [Tumebacillus lipolyticus]|uniref:Heme ABC transporter ATP-binding protein n=1 Tax=Tumebacillus lipolyticus TaxID=1280370 RepID=A0ABW4ZX04_9BACL
MKVAGEQLSVSREGRRLLADVSLHVRSGELVGLIGPNGSGKSTLLKSIYRALEPDAGRVTLDDRPLDRMSAREAAQKMAVVGQESSTEFEFSVAEIVQMGRHPHQRFFGGDQQGERALLRQALVRVGLDGWEDRSFLTLSGGEKQRVLIARCLVQQAQFLVLDEPTNHLDIRYQLQLMDLIGELGLTTLTALHDLNLAAAYCDRIYVIADGRIALSGTPAEVLTPEVLLDVFGVQAEVSTHPQTGRLRIDFFSNWQRAGERAERA